MLEKRHVEPTHTRTPLHRPSPLVSAPRHIALEFSRPSIVPFEPRKGRSDTTHTSCRNSDVRSVASRSRGFTGPFGPETSQRAAASTQRHCGTRGRSEETLCPRHVRSENLSLRHDALSPGNFSARDTRRASSYGTLHCGTATLFGSPPRRLRRVGVRGFGAARHDKTSSVDRRTSLFRRDVSERLCVVSE
jgi:hypothetical protein